MDAGWIFIVPCLMAFVMLILCERRRRDVMDRFLEASRLLAERSVGNEELRRELRAVRSANVDLAESFNVRQFQRQHADWVKEHFGDDRPINFQAFKVFEEAGELAAALYAWQLEPMGDDSHEEHLKKRLADAICDIIISVTGVATKAQIDLESAWRETWRQVKSRSHDRVVGVVADGPLEGQVVCSTLGSSKLHPPSHVNARCSTLDPHLAEEVASLHHADKREGESYFHYALRKFNEVQKVYDEAKTVYVSTPYGA